MMPQAAGRWRYASLRSAQPIRPAAPREATGRRLTELSGKARCATGSYVIRPIRALRPTCRPHPGTPPVRTREARNSGPRGRKRRATAQW